MRGIVISYNIVVEILTVPECVGQQIIDEMKAVKCDL